METTNKVSNKKIISTWVFLNSFIFFQKIIHNILGLACIAGILLLNLLLTDPHADTVFRFVCIVTTASLAFCFMVLYPWASINHFSVLNESIVKKNDDDDDGDDDGGGQEAPRYNVDTHTNLGQKNVLEFPVRKAA